MKGSDSTELCLRHKKSPNTRILWIFVISDLNNVYMHYCAHASKYLPTLSDSGCIIIHYIIEVSVSAKVPLPKWNICLDKLMQEFHGIVCFVFIFVLILYWKFKFSKIFSFCISKCLKGVPFIFDKQKNCYPIPKQKIEDFESVFSGSWYHAWLGLGNKD